MTGTDTTERAALCADVVALARIDGVRHVLLVRRADDADAYPGYWALPGGGLDPGETFRQAAVRELAEETGLKIADLGQLGIYDAPRRDPRGRVISVVFYAVLPDAPCPIAGDDASAAEWVPFDLALRRHKAFDHDDILADVASVVPFRP
ncbi:NUDIX domain-containing protein [Amycolatopsis sp. NPDC054798]